jgi:methylated-DNA-[protein]-cysteine S-methyltransferase
MTFGFALFETAIGRCGIAWGERGLVGVQLPEAEERRTRARMLRRFPGAAEEAPPPTVQRVIHAMATLLRGEPSDLSDVTLDMRGVPPLHRRVYAIARAIAPGETLTYGEIAARLGDPSAAREVGRALGRNPFPLVVPCHRVLAAGGRTGGFSAPGGVATKRRLLAIEGARALGGPTLFD